MLTLMWVMPFFETPYPLRYGFGAVLLAFVVARQRAEGATAEELGFAWKTFAPALQQLAVPTAIALLALLAFGWANDGLRLPRKSVGSWVFLPFWAFLQQFLLLGFCHRRLRVLCGSGTPVVLASGLLFGLLHLPNPTLMVACSVSGFLWAAQFERTPNLFATALSHAVLSTCLSHSIPKSILVSMRVGYRYLVN
jgi:membrane protease YdiL (CAAX protease family)